MALIRRRDRPAPSGGADSRHCAMVQGEEPIGMDGIHGNQDIFLNWDS